MQRSTFVLLAFLVPTAAQAQWTASLGTAARYATMTEYNQSGHRQIREQGWLPGLEGMAGYRAGLLVAFVEGRLFDAAIDYDGKVQSGQPFRSSTQTRFSQLQAGLRYRVLEQTDVSAALEYDGWRRVIRGSADITGLHEATNSRRVLIGIQHRESFISAGMLTTDVQLVFAQPEQLTVCFSGLLDDVSLRTRSATGVVLGLVLVPRAYPALQFAVRFDLMTIGRSDPQGVTRNGLFAGSIIQPEHQRRSTTLSLRYLF